MARTRKNDPAPRNSSLRVELWKPQLSGSIALGVPREHPRTLFRDVLDSRHSCRALTPISFELLGALLWHAARTRATREGDEWEKRAAPSAGGLHPIHLLVLPSDRDDVLLYDPLSHSLQKLAGANALDVVQLRAEFHEVVPTARGVFLVLAADGERTRSGYTNPDSLVWRDAGCLIATTQFVASWLGLGSCPLGVLGGGVVDLVAPSGGLTPAGVLALGTRADSKVPVESR